MTKPHIPFIDLYTPKKAKELDHIIGDLRGVVEKSQFILGEAVGEFEKAMARVAGCDFGIGVNSGLDALILSLRALKIGAGDEVITAPNSFVASAAAIELVGARTRFADVANDFNLDPIEVRKAITPRTKAIMVVHLTGYPCRMDEIQKIAKEHCLMILEDAAQAIGATWDGKPVGSWSELGAFSLHPLKNLHVWGDGGMITTSSSELSQVLRLQRNHGLRNRDEVDFFSYNSRLDTIQAVVGMHLLNLLNETTEKRIRNASIYRQRLSDLSEFVTLPECDSKRARHVYHVFQLRVKDRDQLQKHLLAKGIETKIHYPIPIHLQKAAAGLGYQRGSFPIAERLSTEILSVPVRENLTESEIQQICDEVTRFYKG